MARVVNYHTALPATNALIHERNELYLPLLAWKLVLVYRPRRDAGLSRPRHDHGEVISLPETAT